MKQSIAKFSHVAKQRISALVRTQAKSVHFKNITMENIFSERIENEFDRYNFSAFLFFFKS